MCGLECRQKLRKKDILNLPRSQRENHVTEGNNFGALYLFTRALLTSTARWKDQWMGLDSSSVLQLHNCHSILLDRFPSAGWHFLSIFRSSIEDEPKVVRQKKNDDIAAVQRAARYLFGVDVDPATRMKRSAFRLKKNRSFRLRRGKSSVFRL